jgi:hypothetical protein
MSAKGDAGPLPELWSHADDATVISGFGSQSVVGLRHERTPRCVIG